MNETTYIYIVHSDVNENNIYAEFPEEQAAIEYARKNASELTYVDKVEVLLDEDGEVIDEFDSETIWVYSDEETPTESEEDYWDMLAAEYEDQEANKHTLGDTTWFESFDADELVETLEENETEVECKECFDLFPKTDCVKVAFGYICPTCAKCEVADEDMFKVDFPEYEKFPSENEMIPGEPNPEPTPDNSPNPDPMPETEETENDLISDPEEVIPFLVKDEEEAIAGYEAAEEVVTDSNLENKEEILDTIDHIKEEEEEHIEELNDLVDTKEDIVPEDENDPISNPEEKAIEPLKEDYEFTLADTISEEMLYKALVEEGALVSLEAGNTGEFGISFSDGGVYSDTTLEITEYNGRFSATEYYTSDDGDYKEGDTVIETDSFETLYAALQQDYPEVFIGSESLVEHVNEEHPAIESDQELEGTDNAVVDCKVADVVTHSEDEKPVDCEGKKKPLEKPLTEDTHAKYAKPEGDRKETYNNALKYAKKDNTPYIYGYSGINGKFFAFSQPVKVTGDIVEKEKEFRSRYKNCKVVYVAYPDKAFMEGYQKVTPEEMEEYGIDEDGCSIDSYDEYVRCTWCEDIYTKDMCDFEADFGWLCDRCQAAIASRGERLTMIINPTEDDFKKVLHESKTRLTEAYAFRYHQYIEDPVWELVIAVIQAGQGAYIAPRGSEHTFNPMEVRDSADFFYGILQDLFVAEDGTVMIRTSTREMTLRYAAQLVRGTRPNRFRPLVNALAAAVDEIDAAHNPGVAERRNQTVQAQLTPELAEEFKQHITRIRFRIPLLNYSSGRDSEGEYLTPKAEKKLDSIYNTFFNNAFAQDAEAAGMVEHRDPSEDTNSNIASSWKPVGKIAFDCKVGDLSKAAQDLIKVSRPTSNKDVSGQREIDCVRLAIVLIRYFNNDVRFFETGNVTEEISMTSDELMSKYGTDDVDLINAGKEPEERVELKEEAPEYDLTEVNKLLKEIRGGNKKKSIHMR